jgi:hypothetical protein
VKKVLKRLKMTEKQSISTSFRVGAHPGAGQNTQQTMILLANF